MRIWWRYSATEIRNSRQLSERQRFLYAGLGTSFALGATPRAIAGGGQDAPAAMDGDDLKSYRTLLAKSDDHEHSLLAYDAH
jgi:hypothetical protein